MADEEKAIASQPMTLHHVLLFPFPGQGHVPPMLKLADLIAAADDTDEARMHITFVNSEHVHTRLSRHSSVLTRLGRLPRFRFRTITDGLPDDDSRPFHKVVELEQSMRTRSREAYRELLLQGEDGWPPVTCVVADGILPVALDVAEELGIPAMILRTSSASSLWAYCCIPELIQNGEIPFSDGADLDEPIHGVAGMEGLLRRRDLPSLIRNARSADDPGIQYANTFSSNLTRARALILNTFESLEPSALSQIRALCPATYTLGPIHLLARRIAASDAATATASLWREDRGCLVWLDDQPVKSVVYVSFGSSLVMSRHDVVEFLEGLVDSGHRFMWVVRPGLMTGGEELLQQNLREVAKERGCLVEWAPQEEVLAHPAVGCFLTHSGWNSTVESIVAGVPMICWPFFVDQMVNSRFVGEVWRIGLDMKDMRGREVVGRMIRRAMEGEEAEEMRRAVEVTAAEARRGVEEGGSSYDNLQRLIAHIKSLSLSSQKMLK